MVIFITMKIVSLHRVHVRVIMIEANGGEIFLPADTGTGVVTKATEVVALIITEILCGSDFYLLFALDTTE